LFGLLCAYARSLNREVELNVMNGRHNARAYCLYTRFGLHLTKASTSFLNYVDTMRTSYQRQHITIQEIVDVITGQSHHLVKDTQFDTEYCGRGKEATQQAIARLGRDAWAQYAPVIQRTKSAGLRAQKRKQLETYVRLQRRSLLNQPIPGHDPADHYANFQKTLHHDDPTLTSWIPSPTGTAMRKFDDSPTEQNFVRELNLGTKRQRTGTPQPSGKAAWVAKMRAKMDVVPINPTTSNSPQSPTNILPSQGKTGEQILANVKWPSADSSVDSSADTTTPRGKTGAQMKQILANVKWPSDDMSVDSSADTTTPRGKTGAQMKQILLHSKWPSADMSVDSSAGTPSSQGKTAKSH
jgi:hypothetical protein